MKNIERTPETPKKPIKKLKTLNVILTILVVVSIIFLAIRFKDLYFQPKNSNGGQEPPLEPVVIPLPTEPIINTHEHIENPKVVNRWLKSQQLCNVSATIMVGSPNSTFWSKPKGPFIEYLENNEFLIELAKETNGEIIAFPTLNPNDPDNVDKLKDYLFRGARGLNLWTGHHGTLSFSWGNTTLYDWLGPLNRTDMYPVYEYCQKNRVPIIWSNNLGVREVRDHLWEILEKFPDMIIKIPHFGICFRSYNLPFIEEFLTKYKGAYTCFSWGHPDFVMEKFENISTVRNRAIKDFFTKYQDQILFGTDIVPTDNKRKTVEWMRLHTQAYKDVLEKDNYHVEIYNFTPDGKDFIDYLRGLNLSKNILEKVYYKNTIKFLNGLRSDEEFNESLLNTRGSIGILDKDENSTGKSHSKSGQIFILDFKLLSALPTALFLAISIKKNKFLN